MINCSSTVQRIIDRLLFRDVDIADDSGWTPLIIASSAGHTDIVHMLVEKGAKVTAQSELTLTLIIYTLRSGYGSDSQNHVYKLYSSGSNQMDWHYVIIIHAV